LGELAYTSEAAERLRVELRASARALREAEDKVEQVRQELEVAVVAKQALEQELHDMRGQLQNRDEVESRLSVSACIHV
jgi:chromosome segregation ATPase